MHELGDLTLVSAMIRLEALMNRVRGNFEIVAKGEIVGVTGLGEIYGLETEVYNAAAAVSRQIWVLGVPEERDGGQEFLFGRPLMPGALEAGTAALAETVTAAAP